MSLPKAKAKQILAELGIDRPELLVHLREICVERGAFVREGKLDNAEARLTVKGNRGVITVKPDNAYVARKRFSIAHELGHFELHRKHKSSLHCDVAALNDWSIRSAVHSLESEANEFASELLMPEEFIKAEINRAQPGIALLEDLSERYQTSLFATTRRFLDLTHEACAAVFFKKAKMSYAWKSKYFSEQSYNLATKLSPNSYAFSAAQGRAVPNHMAEVDASVWIHVPEALAKERILEQARYFPVLEIGMTLIWVHNGRLIWNF